MAHGRFLFNSAYDDTSISLNVPLTAINVNTPDWIKCKKFFSLRGPSLEARSSGEIIGEGYVSLVRFE